MWMKNVLKTEPRTVCCESPLRFLIVEEWIFIWKDQVGTVARRVHYLQSSVSSRSIQFPTIWYIILSHGSTLGIRVRYLDNRICYTRRLEIPVHVGVCRITYSTISNTKFLLETARTRMFQVRVFNDLAPDTLTGAQLKSLFESDSKKRVVASVVFSFIEYCLYSHWR